MGLFSSKKTKDEKNYPSVDTTKTPSSVDEPKKARRGRPQKQKTPAKPKGKGGRPKEHDKNEKEIVVFYLNKEQKEELRRRAKKANLPISSYIIVKLFGVK